jgi:hypothetical protein
MVNVDLNIHASAFSVPRVPAFFNRPVCPLKELHEISKPKNVQTEGHLKLLTQRQPTKRRDKSESEGYQIAASGF